MNINSIDGVSNSLSTPNTNTVPKKVQNSFAELLKDSIENVNEMQHQSNMKTESFAEGKVEDLHHVMITAQKASITLETTVQIQRKVIDAYNEVMRMQV